MFLMANSCFSCDDTLVMLLTAKNPTSEFSKSIRSFMNNLTVLGTALKYSQKDDYSTELTGVLDSWLDFSKKYMTNPPEEAKNDRQWIEKMSKTAKKIGEIRKLINIKKYSDAHNDVLELSNTIGSFFESVGVTDEKQVFITASADINDLQRLISKKEYIEAKNQIHNKIIRDLNDFEKYLKEEEDKSIASNTSKIINSISFEIENNKAPEEIDKKISMLRTSFEELRSRILMEEWFSDDEVQKESN